MLPSFESVVAGRTDLASLLPDLVYCNNLGTSHPDPSYIARLGNCTSHYRTNPQFPGAARLCEWREGGQCRAGPHIFASRAPPARPMPSPPPSPPPMPRPPPGPPPAAYTFAELTVGRTILPTGVWCFMVYASACVPPTPPSPCCPLRESASSSARLFRRVRPPHFARAYSTHASRVLSTVTLRSRVVVPPTWRCDPRVLACVHAHPSLCPRSSTRPTPRSPPCMASASPTSTLKASRPGGCAAVHSTPGADASEARSCIRVALRPRRQ